MFNKPVDHLPPSLTHLIFGISYSKISDLDYENIRPSLCGKFNEKVDHLPPSLTHLFFLAENFNQPVENLPPNLTHLVFGKCFNNPINMLPTSYKKIIIGTPKVNFHHSTCELPPSTECEFRETFLACIPKRQHLKYVGICNFFIDSFF